MNRLKKKIYLQPLSFNAKSRRPRAKKKILAMPRALITKFGSSKHGQGKTLCIRPPIYGIKNRGQA
jgi:hypothetical protein